MDLNQLRERLSDIDRQLVEFVAERQSIVAEIGALKQTEHRPTRDFSREKQVLDRARAQAEALGVAPVLAESLMQLLIQSSLTNQEQARVRADGHGSGRPALVIGGSGKMGCWFAKFLDSQGFNVTIADPAPCEAGYRYAADWRTLEDSFAVTVISAPISITAGILAEMAAQPRQGLILDIGSLKSPLIDNLRAVAAAGGRITSLHPMLGPDTELLSGRHVIFMNCGSEQALEDARHLFASTMAIQIEMELEEHDRLIAYVLGLSHALNVAFFTALAESGEAAPSLSKLSSTTFDAQLAVAELVAQDNPHLYFEIQSLNPHGLAPLEELSKAVGRITDIVRGGDEDAFARLMERGREYLGRRVGPPTPRQT